MGHEGHRHDGEDGPKNDPALGHEYDHAHDHAHDHGHAHGHGRHSDRDPIAPLRDSGAARVLFLDAPSGLAGDMIIAALVDVGVPAQEIANAIASLPIAGFHLAFGTCVRSGIVATTFDVRIDVPQPPRSYASIRTMLREARLADAVREGAERTFLRLATAEAKVHRTTLDDVHFHEVGAIDAIVDVVGSASALAYLGAALVVSPLPMGRGYVNAEHGRLPLPAPATVECLAGLETYDGGLDFEFVTPTGAAIVGAHAVRSQRWPSFAPERTGWGAGTANLRDRPNVLRAVLGTAPGSENLLGGRFSHTILEANVDDATGELAGSWIQTLLAAGALDAWASPITMKKGRPGLTLGALSASTQADALAHVMLRETTSLGVRRYEVDRVERPRRIEHVDTPYGRLPIKVAGGPFGPPQVKPEFDACAEAARAHGIPVRQVVACAMAAALTRFAPEPSKP